MVRVLETMMRLAHPIMPYITEEIWQKVSPLTEKNGDTIMLQPYPIADQKMIDSEAEKEIEWVMQFILGLRENKR